MRQEDIYVKTLAGCPERAIVAKDSGLYDLLGPDEVFVDVILPGGHDACVVRMEKES